MKTGRYFTLIFLLVVVLAVGVVMAYTTATNKNVEEFHSESSPANTTTNEMGRLVLPLEGVLIKGKLADLEAYIDAESQEEKDRILEILLNDPDNVVINIEKSSPPPTDGEAVALIPD